MLTPENHYSTLHQNSCLHCVHELGYTLFPLNSHYLKKFSLKCLSGNNSCTTFHHMAS